MHQLNTFPLQNLPDPNPEVEPNINIPELPDPYEPLTTPGPHVPEQTPPGDPSPSTVPREFGL